MTTPLAAGGVVSERIIPQTEAKHQLSGKNIVGLFSLLKYLLLSHNSNF